MSRCSSANSSDGRSPVAAANIDHRPVDGTEPVGDRLDLLPRVERPFLLRSPQRVRNTPLRRVGVEQPPGDGTAEHLPQRLRRLEAVPFRDRQTPRVHVLRREIREPLSPRACAVALPEQPAQLRDRHRLRLMHLQVLLDQLAERHRRRRVRRARADRAPSQAPSVPQRELANPPTCGRTEPRPSSRYRYAHNG